MTCPCSPIFKVAWPLAAGRWSLVTGRWSLAASRWSLVAWPLVAWPLGVAIKLLPVGTAGGGELAGKSNAVGGDAGNREPASWGLGDGNPGPGDRGVVTAGDVGAADAVGSAGGEKSSARVGVTAVAISCPPLLATDAPRTTIDGAGGMGDGTDANRTVDGCPVARETVD